jgi:hypothetical protein
MRRRASDARRRFPLLKKDRDMTDDMTDQAQMLSLRAIGIAAGLVAIILFALLYLATGALPSLVAGSGGGAMLLAISLLAGRAKE